MRAVPRAANAWRSKLVGAGSVLNVQRLKTRPQFQTVLASGPGVKTAHFALHSCELTKMSELRTAVIATRQDSFEGSIAALQPVLGAMVPKRWAKRAVTRNAIKRQIYTVSDQFFDLLAPQAHVIRLRAAFDRETYVSATSDALKFAVRTELLELFSRASAHSKLRA